jgi:hypothetical protein
MKQSTGFLGTYFERDVVLRLERWARIIAWCILVGYTLESGYNVFQSVYNANIGGYPMDWFYVFVTLLHILQGAMLFIIIQVAAKILLIMLDIEDNTRRVARANRSKE